MKKTTTVISLMLILCMLSVFPVYSAIPSQVENADKYMSDLITVMESASDDEVVAVWIWLNYAISDQEVEEEAFEKCGLTSDTLRVDYDEYETIEEARKAEKEKVNLWRTTKYAIINEFYDGVNHAFIDKADIKDEQIVYSSLSSASVIAQLPAAKIREISTYQDVVSLHHYTEENFPPPTDNTVPETEPYPTYPFDNPLPEGNLYENIFLERLDIERVEGNESLYYYEELYYYYSEQGNTTPGYALVLAASPYTLNATVSSYFGDYVIYTGCHFAPYIHGYHIYSTGDDKIYTLEEAYYAGVDGIEKALEFLNGEVIALVGDADANFNLNIKDATWIQKYLANYVELYDPCGFTDLTMKACDYNKDGKINIKDATAIQKHLAKIEY